MWVTNRTLLPQVAGLAKRTNHRVCHAPAVAKEARHGGYAVPRSIEEEALTDADRELIERWIPKTLGSEALTIWKRTGWVKGIGEIESVAIAKRIGGLFVSDDENARRFGSRALGSDRVHDIKRLLRTLNSEVGLK